MTRARTPGGKRGGERPDRGIKGSDLDALSFQGKSHLDLGSAPAGDPPCHAIARGRDREQPAGLERMDKRREAAAHSVGERGESPRRETCAQVGGAVGGGQAEWRRAPDAHVAGIPGPLGKACEEGSRRGGLVRLDVVPSPIDQRQDGLICLLDPTLVEVHARRAHIDGREAEPLLGDPAECLVVGGDDRGHRGSDEGDEEGVARLDGIAELAEQAVIPSQDGVHVTQSRREDRTPRGEPSRLVEPADVAGAPPGVADHGHAAEFIEDRDRTRLVGREGRKSREA